MKALVFALAGIFAFESLITIELDAIKNSYLLAPTDKKRCKEMITELNDSQEPICLAYYGAFKAI
jgi:hypothetical protein